MRIEFNVENEEISPPLLSSTEYATLAQLLMRLVCIFGIGCWLAAPPVHSQCTPNKDTQFPGHVYDFRFFLLFVSSRLFSTPSQGLPYGSGHTMEFNGEVSSLN